MKIKIILSCCVLMSSCGSKDWRLGNQHNDLKIQNKREDERDSRMKRALKIEKNTTKHYINEYKKRDGKLNLFYRDGFDKIF